MVFIVLFLFLLLQTCACSNQACIEDEIVYWENFESEGEIMVQFVGNTTAVLGITLVKSFFILPTQFYQQNVAHHGKTLPLFFVNLTRSNFFSLILRCYKFKLAEELDTEAADVLKIREGVLNIQRELHRIFPNSTSLNEFIESLHPNLDENCISTFFFSEKFFNKARCLIPVVYFQKLSFVASSIGNATSEVTVEESKQFPTYNFESLLNDENLINIGFGFNAICYKIGIFQKDSTEFHQNLVFKNLRKALQSTDNEWDLNELTIFQEAGIAVKSAFSTLSCLVIDKITGHGVGYLTKIAKYGSLNFKNYLNKLDSYFFEQFLELAKSIEILQSKNIYHGDIHVDNVFVDEIEPSINDSTDAISLNNYRFLLGDFGLAFIPHLSSLNSRSSTEEPGITEYGGCDCAECMKQYNDDWESYAKVWAELFLQIALNHARSLSYDKFIVLIEYKSFINGYLNAKQYLADVKSGKFSNSEHLDERITYEIKENVGRFIFTQHGKISNFEKGQFLHLDGNSSHYWLYSISDKLTTYDSNIKLDEVVRLINEFAREHYDIECFLDKK